MPPRGWSRRSAHSSAARPAGGKGETLNEREYDILYRVEEQHWWYVALHELVVRFVAREAAGRGPLAILDAGCGTGRLGQLLQPFGRVVGCDLSPRALDYSRRRGLDVFAADLNTAELGEGRYDVVTAIDVLYHRAVADDLPVLQRLERALKPGGVLILNLVAHEFLRSPHDLAVHTRKRYTRGGFLPLLAQAGLATEKASYRLGFLFLPIAGYRLARRLLQAGADPSRVASDVHLPPAAVNLLLLGLARAENRRIERGTLPLGTSLFVVARKPCDGPGQEGGGER